MSEDVIKEVVLIYREVPVERLIEALYAGWDEIDEDLKVVMRAYSIPEVLLPYIKESLRQYIVKMLRERGLPEEEWMVEPLLKLFIRLSKVMLPDDP
jgi:hypothetical protein